MTRTPISLPHSSTLEVEDLWERAAEGSQKDRRKKQRRRIGKIGNSNFALETRIGKEWVGPREDED